MDQVAQEHRLKVTMVTFKTPVRRTTLGIALRYGCDHLDRRFPQLYPTNTLQDLVDDPEIAIVTDRT